MSSGTLRTRSRMDLTQYGPTTPGAVAAGALQRIADALEDLVDLIDTSIVDDDDDCMDTAV